MQKNPSEQLVLLTLDELAEAGRNIGHEDADMYIELARQASLNQGKFPIASFVLSVLGVKASDLITKALTKSLKDKSCDKKGRNYHQAARCSSAERAFHAAGPRLHVSSVDVSNGLHASAFLQQFLSGQIWLFQRW